MSEIELFEAVKSGNREAVKERLTAGAALDQQDKQGWTVLNWAAAKGDVEMVELLLEHGADPLMVGRDLRTPQMIALAAGRAEVIKVLRRAEAQVKGSEAVEPDRKYCSAYHLEELRRFAGWAENRNGGESPQPSGEEVVFLHQDYKVTKSIWPNEDVIFSDVTDQWKQFCSTELSFTVPDNLDLITPA